MACAGPARAGDQAIGDLYLSVTTGPSRQHRAMMGGRDRGEGPEFGASFMVLVFIAFALAMFTLAGVSVSLDKTGWAARGYRTRASTAWP
jgi:hypothetical protein